jgi:hypothetical protein
MKSASLASTTAPINQTCSWKVTSIALAEEERATVNVGLSEERQVIPALPVVSIGHSGHIYDDDCSCVRDESLINDD